MQVQITIRDQNNNNSTWSIVAQEGKFQGELVGNAEGLSLTDASIVDGAIVGQVQALWGAELVDAVHENLPTLKGLGLGRAMGKGWKPITRANKAVIVGDELRDAESQVVLHQVRRLSVFNGEIKYQM